MHGGTDTYPYPAGSVVEAGQGHGVGIDGISGCLGVGAAGGLGGGLARGGRVVITTTVIEMGRL